MNRLSRPDTLERMVFAMNDNQLTPEQLQALLNYASKRLGTTPEQLAKTVQTGGAQSLASKMKPGDAEKFRAIASDQAKLEQMVNSPQAQKLIQQLLGGQGPQSNQRKK